MWRLFKALFPAKDTEDTGARLERLEINMRRLQEEWTDVYGKFRVLQMRVAKQVQRLDANSSEEEPQRAESDGAEAPGEQQGQLLSLTPGQRRLQAQILARRAKGG